MNNIYPIKYKESYNVVMLNEIIKGKQSMTLQEAKLLRLLITQVVKEDKDFKTYIVSIKDLANYLNVPDSNLYRDIRNICTMLMTRIVKLATDNPKNPWKVIQWLQLAEYDGQGKVKLMLSNQMAPYVLGLNAWFTKYPIKEVFYMSSFYAIRIYELLNMEKNIIQQYEKKEVCEIIFNINYLRQILDCENKFKQISQFKQKILNIAVKEINKCTNIQIAYECIKTSRTITDIKFIVVDSKQNEIKVNEPKEINSEEKSEIKINDSDNLLSLLSFIEEPLEEKDLKFILETAKGNINLIKSKYNIAKQQLHITNLTAWLISAIKADYAEPVEAKSNKPMIATPKVNRFVNYEQDNYDFEKLAKLERAFIKKNLEENKKEERKEKSLDELINEVRGFIKEPLENQDIETLLKETGNNVSIIKDKYKNLKNVVDLKNINIDLFNLLLLHVKDY